MGNKDEETGWDPSKEIHDNGSMIMTNTDVSAVKECLIESLY